VAQIAAHMAELRPAFRRPFGSPRATASVEEVVPSAACFSQQDAGTAKLTGGALRAAVWTETDPTNASAVCMHLVVINAALEATKIFRATLNSSALHGRTNLKAIRMFAEGPTLNVSQGVITADFIGPGQTAIYRIGCEAPAADATNLAHPLMRVTPSGDEGGTADAPVSAWTVLPAVLPPGGDFSHAAYDARLSVMVDTAVQVAPARHSLRINVPSDAPVVFPLPGAQLVPTEPTFAPKDHRTQVGDKMVGVSTTLPGGQAFKVTLSLQASPCGANITLLGGAWTVTNATCLKDTRGFVRSHAIYCRQALRLGSHS